MLKQVLLGLLITSYSIAIGQVDAVSVLNKVSQKYKSLNSLQANVSLRTTNKDSDIDETNEISVYKKGDKFKFTLDKVLTVVSDASTLWTISPDDEEVTIDIYEEDEEEGEINMSNVFTIYENGFEQYYVESLNKNGNNYHIIDLIPEDKERDFFKIKVFVDSKAYYLSEMVVMYKDGTKADYQIKDFKMNLDLKDKMFQVTQADYPGFHFEDLR